ncbi:MAG TPA: ABC transporter substrate-binding protein [Amaricoccus sp.]|uniref:ABC transporter substrate-binding protein n=1 Tax=Amaricoccus sp. TaxID=1872485 RepID=UPI001D93EBBB|nr:ABC transporter substrate-binding protein [Amaricoccus sp.]MCB1372855.1 ABC transporter substrate-binding protein [Paracoccaceae bacterium]HPG23271.1 ABC transporter substrate-binding protein [Amaricoccus sp.]HRW16245.1 ABC transporter substrate-binding protein [Amaricoccus sp.]
MNRLLLATAASALIAGAAAAQDPVNVGIILGFTGPLESITPGMAESAEFAFAEVNEAGVLGAPLNPVRADSTCVDAAAATAAAERLITAENVAAILGADCSGVTIAIANSVAVPNGVVMVSPSATSPALSTIDDNGFFFRVAPSDARQGEVIADVLKDRGLDNFAITYTNNDYGKGLADAIAAAIAASGGTVAIVAAHEDGKGDYSAEVAALQASGAEHLIVAGYVDQGGVGIVQASLDTGAFESFIFPDGMYGQSLIDSIGEDINGKVIGTLPGVEGEGADTFAALASGAGMDPTGTYVPESYDAAALIALSMAAAGGPDRTGIRDKLLDVANAPGEPILAGELAKGLELAAAGTDIDYQGATGVELIGPGEAKGSYRVYEIQDNAPVTIEYR